MVYSTGTFTLQQMFDMVAGNTGIVTAQQLEKLVDEYRGKLELLPEEQRLQISAVIMKIERLLRSMSLSGLSKVDFEQFSEFAREDGASTPGGAGAPPAGPSYAPAVPTASTNSSKNSGGGTLFVLAALAAVVYNLK